MAKDTKKNVGFRCDEALYEEVKTIAEKEDRSISNVFTTIVSAAVQRYKVEGWATLTKDCEGK